MNALSRIMLFLLFSLILNSAALAAPSITYLKNGVSGQPLSKIGSVWQMEPGFDAPNSWASIAVEGNGFCKANGDCSVKPIVAFLDISDPNIWTVPSNDITGLLDNQFRFHVFEQVGGSKLMRVTNGFTGQSVTVNVDLHANLSAIKDANGQAVSALSCGGYYYAYGSNFGNFGNSPPVLSDGWLQDIYGTNEGRVKIQFSSSYTQKFPNSYIGWWANQVGFIVPPMVGTYSINVNTNGILSSTLNVTVDCTTLSLIPSSGTGNSIIRIVAFDQLQSNIFWVGTRTIEATPVPNSNNYDLVIPEDLEPGTHEVYQQYTMRPLLTVYPTILGSTGQAIKSNPFTIIGTNFGSTRGTIKIDGVTASIVSWSMNSVTFTIPSTIASGTHQVSLTNNLQVSNSLPISVAGVDAITPTSGVLNTAISLTGAGFGASQGSNSVKINSVTDCIIDSWSDTQIVCRVPAEAPGGQRFISVQLGGLSSNAMSFGVVPTLLGISSDHGFSGDAITLLGNNLLGSLGARFVKFDGVSVEVSSWQNDSVVAVVPSQNAGQSQVSVALDGYSSNSLPFLIQKQPWINKRSPSLGTSGTQVVLTGQNFGPSQGSVKVGNLVATISLWTDTSVTFVLPTGLIAGENPIVLTAANGFQSNTVTIAIRGNDTWILITQAPHDRAKHSSVWTGNEMLIWGGENVAHGLSAGARYNPSTDSWVPMKDDSSVPLLGKAVWNGSDMFVWGENGVGARYNPSSNSWVAVSSVGAPPSALNYSISLIGQDCYVAGGSNQSGIAIPWALYKYNSLADTWTLASGYGAPSARYDHSAGWTGTDLIIWGGSNGSNFLNDGASYNPVSDTWTSLPGTSLAARSKASSVWTGTQMILWGGKHGETSTDYLSDGSRYNPATRTWLAMASLPSAPGRTDHSAVWTGSKMIVWGGQIAGISIGDGSTYDPNSNSWTTMTSTNAPEARVFHSAVWNGTEMIIWGGRNVQQAFNVLLSSGGRYNPLANSWAPVGGRDGITPRSQASAIWSGAEVIIWGGLDAYSQYVNTGARYSPTTNSWLSTSTALGVPVPRGNHTATWVPTNSSMYISGGWNGVDGSSDTRTQQRYSPASDSWTYGATPRSFRTKATSIWTGSYIIEWGGQTFSKTNINVLEATNTGDKYDPVLNSWSAGGISTLNAPTSRIQHTAVWTGSEMLIWGGEDLPNYFSSGGRYSVTSNIWTPMSMTGAPVARSHHSAAWTGSELVIFGGTNGSVLSSGGRYSVSTNSWVATSIVSAPSARKDHSAVWNGSAMIVFGGTDSVGNVPSIVYKFTPSSNTWLSTPQTNSPTVRNAHFSIWTGNEMVVWGGANQALLDDGAMYIP